MKKKVYGVVLVGCGHIGEEHIRDIYYRKNVRIIATVDFDVERAALFARKYSGGHRVKYGADYREFITRPDVDIVIVATYAQTHYAIVKDCIAAGKHVLCEKPVAPTYDEAKEFYRMVQGSESRVLIAHILRHNAMYQKAAEMIRSGLIGEVRLIRMSQNHHIMNRERYMKLLQDCSPIVDCGVHYVDVIRWLTGLEITAVSGTGAIVDPTIPAGTYDHGRIQMRLSNGAVAYYEATWTETCASENQKEFIGTKGRITLTLADNRIKNQEEGNLIEYYDAEHGEYHTINVNGAYKDMYAQFSTLVDMIENGTEGSPTMEDAMEAFRVVTECDRMIRGKLGI